MLCVSMCEGWQHMLWPTEGQYELDGDTVCAQGGCRVTRVPLSQRLALLWHRK